MQIFLVYLPATYNVIINIKERIYNKSINMSAYLPQAYKQASIF